MVSVSKWPVPGEVLPVLVNPKNHSDIEVIWDEVPTGNEASRERAERLAETLRTEREATATTMASVPMTIDGYVVNVVASQSDADPVERLAKLAELHGAGVIDDEKFNALRDQILGQPGLG